MAKKEEEATRLMIALDYARTHKPAQVALKYGVTSQRVRAIWRSLPEEQKEKFRADAKGIREEIREVVIAEQAQIVHDSSTEIAELLGLTLSEYKRRLQNDPDSVKTSDLVAFTKLALSTIAGGDPEDEHHKRIVNQFALFDEGICIDIEARDIETTE